ncbi:hypothetical protein, partial [Peribacillus muralis]|uniref:hypothetical protein n=1 Tax=Peribacillus muralis TaxID=264697 RepID=UPI001F48D84F
PQAQAPRRLPNRPRKGSARSGKERSKYKSSKNVGNLNSAFVSIRVGGFFIYSISKNNIKKSKNSENIRIT